MRHASIATAAGACVPDATAADVHPNELVDELTARIGVRPANTPAR